MAAGLEEIKKHIKLYWAIGGTLLVLTVVTVAVFYLHLGIVGGIALALLIASVKGSLVGAFFMHLAYDRRLALYSLLVVCALFFIVLMLMPLLAISEMVHQHNVP